MESASEMLRSASLLLQSSTSECILYASASVATIVSSHIGLITEKSSLAILRHSLMVDKYSFWDMRNRLSFELLRLPERYLEFSFFNSFRRREACLWALLSYSL